MTTCTHTENQLLLPHIMHVTTDDAASAIHIYVTSLNGSCDIEMLPDSGADISASYQRAWVNMWTTFHHLALRHKQLMMQQWCQSANCQWRCVWVTSKSRMKFISTLEFREPWCLWGPLAFSQSITLILYLLWTFCHLPSMLPEWVSFHQ